MLQGIEEDRERDTRAGVSRLPYGERWKQADRRENEWTEKNEKRRTQRGLTLRREAVRSSSSTSHRPAS
jgi:hypothetical protein